MAADENKGAASSVRLTELIQVDISSEYKEESCRILKQKKAHFSETSELASILWHFTKTKSAKVYVVEEMAWRLRPSGIPSIKHSKKKKKKGGENIFFGGGAAWPLKMEPKGCPEMSLSGHKTTAANIPE